MIFAEKKGLIREYVISKFKIARHGIVYLSAKTTNRNLLKQNK